MAAPLARAVRRSGSVALAAEGDARRRLMALARGAQTAGDFAMAVRAATVRIRKTAAAAAVSAVDAELRAIGITPPLAAAASSAAVDASRASAVVDSLTARWAAEDAGGELAGGSLADTIATTASVETFDATNRARVARLSQAAALDDSVRMRWSGYLDPKICPSCMALDGNVVRPADGFGQTPPLHPRCRCLIHAATEFFNAAGITDNSAKIRRIGSAA